MQGSVIERSRSNQPKGYAPREHYNVEPIPHYGVQHNYLYYPLSWTDADTGREYRKGYYDENGEYYENVVFRRTDGVYKNVICQCEYCDTVSKIDWTEGGPLICPQCGGTMKIRSKLDEYTQDPLYPQVRSRGGYADFSDGARSGRFLRVLTVIAVILILGLALSAVIWKRSDERPSNLSPYTEAQLDPGGEVRPGFGTEIYLKALRDGAFAISDEADYDRVLIWIPEEESYFEAESELWAWYNTDVTPPLWQYWYEPISQDYGDYGWMEYENGRWFIEADRNSWIPVPASCDTSSLWHIEARSAEAPEPSIETDAPETPADREAHSEAPLEEDTREDLYLVPKHGGDSDENLVVPRMFNEIIYLEQTAPDAYVITGSFDHDLEPVWQAGSQCYYEPETDMWLWYDVSAEPGRWQYWYQPISLYCNWLEYADGVWYMKNRGNEWVPLPEEYDTAPLWHID